MSHHGIAHKRVMAAVCRYGLHIAPAHLPREERERQERFVTRLLQNQQGVDVSVIVSAIRFGMSHIWPFNQDDYQPFDAADVLKHITKAKAAVAKMSSQGAAPMEGADAVRHLRAMREEHDGE